MNPLPDHVDLVWFVILIMCFVVPTSLSRDEKDLSWGGLISAFYALILCVYFINLNMYFCILLYLYCVLW